MFYDLDGNFSFIFFVYYICSANLNVACKILQVLKLINIEIFLSQNINN